MHVASAYRFLRPTLLVAACYAIAMTAIWWMADAEQPGRNDEDSQTLAASLDSIQKPTPSLTARDVVRIQLKGLAESQRAEGILQCMAFASPGNRLLTGPFEKFARIVRSPTFGPLTKADRTLVGDPVFIGSNARVFVTLLSEEQVSSFVWVLSKQTEAPLAGCWMTDGVFPLDSEGGVNEI